MQIDKSIDGIMKNFHKDIQETRTKLVPLYDLYFERVKEELLPVIYPQQAKLMLGLLEDIIDKIKQRRSFSKKNLSGEDREFMVNFDNSLINDCHHEIQYWNSFLKE